MAVSVVGGPLRHRGGAGNVSRQTFSQSTATADQLVNLFIDQAILRSSGTATGDSRNRYFLASGAEEGRTIWFNVTSTGEANLWMAGGTSTGRLCLEHADDWLIGQYLDGRWRLVGGSGVRLSSST